MPYAIYPTDMLNNASILNFRKGQLTTVFCQTFIDDTVYGTVPKLTVLQVRYEFLKIVLA
jgi:hypothetical protein